MNKKKENKGKSFHVSLINTNQRLFSDFFLSNVFTRKFTGKILGKKNQCDNSFKSDILILRWFNDLDKISSDSDYVNKEKNIKLVKFNLKRVSEYLKFFFA